jgi:hypothetical protein
MDLPEQVLCEKCGTLARVVAHNVDEQALAGHLPPNDHRWRDGFFFEIDCPKCGIRSQSLAPPP